MRTLRPLLIQPLEQHHDSSRDSHDYDTTDAPEAATRSDGWLVRSTIALLVGLTLVFGSISSVSAQESPETEPSEPAEGTVTEPIFERSGEIPSGNISFNGVANNANARWLVDLYDGVFFRPADPGGLDHWLARVAAGGDRSRVAVARSFLNSEEGSRGEATRAYADILRRAPDPAGLAYWTDFLRTNSVNYLRYLHFASDEYFNISGGTNSSFVTSLYQDVLFREPDPAGLAYFVQLVDTGVPRWDVAEDIYLSPESMQNRVTAYYNEILGRNPTPSERTAGAQLIINDDERAVRAALLASDEAFDPFYLQATSD